MSLHVLPPPSIFHYLSVGEVGGSVLLSVDVGDASGMDFYFGDCNTIETLEVRLSYLFVLVYIATGHTCFVVCI